MQRIPLLDLGNVVVQVDFRPFLGWLAEQAGHGDPVRCESFLRSSLFYDFEFGQISRAEFTWRVGKLVRREVSEGELAERFCAIFPGLVPGMEAAITELLAEGPVYGLSNTNEIHLEYLRARYPVMSQFTKLFTSFEMQRRKPYPGIYREVAAELEVEPRSLIFFDDVHANVQGAIRAGLEAHLFEGTERFRAALKGLNKADDRA